jgi:hypothetical protein
MTTSTRAFSLLAAFVLALAGCGARTELDLPNGQERPTTLEVLNRATLDMSIYVLPEMGGQRTRLGSATALTTSHFTIPGRLLSGISTLRFEADPVGSSRVHYSDRITVTPGDTIVLQIPPTGR